jgi:CheY-like chemotaxis protein
VDCLALRNGFNIGSPAEALKLLPSLASQPQLLLTDMMLPGMRGDELAAALRQQLPHLRVLFCSGHTDEQIPTTQAQLQGEFLRKPFTRHDLALSLRAAITSPAEPQ